VTRNLFLTISIRLSETRLGIYRLDVNRTGLVPKPLLCSPNLLALISSIGFGREVNWPWMRVFVMKSHLKSGFSLLDVVFDLLDVVNLLVPLKPRSCFIFDEPPFFTSVARVYGIPCLTQAHYSFIQAQYLWLH